MIYRGVPYPLCFYFTSGDTGSFVWGGGGGYFVMFCFHVLVLVVYSIVNCVRI